MMSKNKNESKRNGTERAAILLLSLGESRSHRSDEAHGRQGRAAHRRRHDAAAEHLARGSARGARAISRRRVENQTSLGVGVDEYCARC